MCFLATVFLSFRVYSINIKAPITLGETCSTNGNQSIFCKQLYCQNGFLRKARLSDTESTLYTSGPLLTMKIYRNDPKFSDRYAWANNADPDQTAPRGAV